MHERNAFLESGEPDGLDLDLLGLFEPLQTILQVSAVSVGIAVSEGCFVLLEGERVLEREGAVELATVLDVDFVFVVEDVEAGPPPPFAQLLGVDEWLHALGVEGLGLVLNKEEVTRLTMLNLQVRFLWVFRTVK